MYQRYQVVAYSHEIGADERGDYTRKADAMREARRCRALLWNSAAILPPLCSAFSLLMYLRQTSK